MKESREQTNRRKNKIKHTVKRLIEIQKVWNSEIDLLLELIDEDKQEVRDEQDT